MNTNINSALKKIIPILIICICIIIIISIFTIKKYSVDTKCQTLSINFAVIYIAFAFFISYNILK